MLQESHTLSLQLSIVTLSVKLVRVELALSTLDREGSLGRKAATKVSDEGFKVKETDRRVGPRTQDYQRRASPKALSKLVTLWLSNN